MPPPNIQVCVFKTYKSVFSPAPQVLDLVALTHHSRVDSKDEAPLFAPVTLGPVGQNGCKHARNAHQKPHRCDASVTSVTALVFDADQGTDSDIDVLHETLTQDGVAHVLYSTFSYDPTAAKQAYRLVVPINRPLQPAEFKAVRSMAIKCWGIPCDPTSSAGLSHSYYFPTARKGAPVRVRASEGAALDVDDYLEGVTLGSGGVGAPAFVDVDSPKHVPSQAALRAECERYLARRPGTKEAAILRAALNGTPLASAGGRHAAVIILRGVLCGLFTDVDPGCLYELVAGSLEAMSEGGRDFALEFADEIEIYQDGLFARDAARITSLRPKDYLWPKQPDDEIVQKGLVNEVRQLFAARDAQPIDN